MRDMPSIASSAYATTVYVPLPDNLGVQALSNTGWSPTDAIPSHGGIGLGNIADNEYSQAKLRHIMAKGPGGAVEISIPKQENEMTRRLVQVIIVDPNENVPLDSSIIYHGEPKLTDATDQELFFEVDIKDLLAKHNEKRVKLIDKKVKERTEHLEPAKIRDLKMVVVIIASF